MDQWGRLIATPKVLAALVLWTVLLASVVARATGLLHGRRFSYMVLVGFVLVLVSYVGLALGMRQSARAENERAQGVACIAM